MQNHELEYEKIILEISERIIAAQKPIRILDALKWDQHVHDVFFKSKFKKLPLYPYQHYYQIAYYNFW